MGGKRVRANKGILNAEKKETRIWNLRFFAENEKLESIATCFVDNALPAAAFLFQCIFGRSEQSHVTTSTVKKEETIFLACMMQSTTATTTATRKCDK
jgi:hypothetical protein